LSASNGRGGGNVSRNIGRHVSLHGIFAILSKRVLT
jgi:hypothetical protein